MSPLGERLAWVVTTLRAAIGAYWTRIARPPQPVWLGTLCYFPRIVPERRPPLPIPLWNHFLRHILRVAQRFQSLHEAWRAGTLKPLRPKRPPAATRPKPPGASPRLRFPRAHGWVNHRVREAASSAGMLHMLLQDEEARAFVAAVPRAGRLLRPLCAALGIAQPDWLRLPPRPRMPRPKNPPRPRRFKLTDPELKLQPYVIAAVRAQKKSGG